MANQVLHDEQAPPRYSAYAEALANPMPEVVFDSAPEPLSTLNTNGQGIQPDGGDTRGSTIVYSQEPKSKFQKYKCCIIPSIIALVLVLVGAIVGVALNSQHHSSGGGSGQVFLEGSPRPSRIPERSDKIADILRVYSVAHRRVPLQFPPQLRRLQQALYYPQHPRALKPLLPQ